MDLGLSGWAILTFGAAAAGWVDAVIGGGGLILIPLIMAVAPGLLPANALATNKFAAVTGTFSAAVTLVRKVGVDTSLALRMIPVAAVGSGLGALMAASISKDVMRPIVIILMLIAGLFVAFRPDFGQGNSTHKPWGRAVALIAVAAIALYDGIFGPGTGMFLIMAFTALLSQDFIRSAALAKVINTATNIGALCVFIAAGHILWKLGIILAIANVAGAQLGARTVLGGGTRLLRAALLTLVVVMSIYLAQQQWFNG